MTTPAIVTASTAMAMGTTTAARFPDVVEVTPPGSGYGTVGGVQDG